MQKTIIILFITLFLSVSIQAKENYSEMSTQELISIMGYVKKDALKKFKKELESRRATMSSKEKKVYKQNLKQSN